MTAREHPSEAQAPVRWTGRHLLAWLQQHPDLLDRPVHLMEMADDKDSETSQYLTRVESDRFHEDEPWVISLSAWPERPTAPPDLNASAGDSGA